MYQTTAQMYSRMPPGPAPGPSKRHPLTNAVNHHHANVNVQPTGQYQQQPQKMPSVPAMGPYKPPLHQQQQPPRAERGERERERERAGEKERAGKENGGKEGGGEPPLPRQNVKVRPPTPPKVISDKTGRMQFNRVGFLGEGGFARVYEVQDPRGSRLACKVVTKSALKTKKAKTKLYAEIKIHKFLDHPNIVTFLDCFEDEDNVYITLELCPSGSLMDMLRRRRRFTEPETRFFMLQLIGACNYMHAHQVIHRDLKLGNLFLDANMNVKVGDFGLAALIENPGERKKTICGTPNYIAPEVLFDTANGHRFEVDIWSIGVILYTLVVGRPPFQTKEVKDIYKRIRDNEYEFPIERPVTSAARSLIQGILAPDPSQRPTLHEIVDAQFFTQGPVPAFIPTSAHDAPPDFRHITRSASDTNLRRLRRSVLLDVEFGSPAHLQQQARDIAARVHGHLRAQEDASAARIAAKDLGGAAGQPHPSAPQGRHTGRDAPLPPPPAPARNIATSVAQQEKEFQKAVQPGSPISALLSSARQPLLVGPTATGAGAGVRESPLMRKLQAAGGTRESPLGRRSVTRGANGVIVEEEEDGEPGSRRPSGSRQNTLGRTAGSSAATTAQKMMSRLEEEEAREERQRQKELEAQKARIVAQMAPVREEADELSEQLDRLEEDDEAEEGESQEYVSGEEGDHGQEDVPRKGHEPLKPAVKLVSAREKEARAREREREEAEAREREVKEKEREREREKKARAAAVPSRERVKDKENVPVASSSRVPGPSSSKVPVASSKPAVDEAGPEAPKPNSFDAAAQILTLAFDARAIGKVFRSPIGSEDVPEERVFIVSWVDYCNKYGMGYALTDGSVGVHFNDSSSLVLSADKEHFDYITSRRHGTIYVRKSHTLSSYPEELKSKVYLLKHFEKYIMERLYGEYDYTFEDTERTKGMEWVQKYLRMKHVIVFKLSHDVLQFNFYDHSKLILSSNGLLITHIDKSYNLTRWTLQDVMAFSLNPPSDATEEERKFNQKLVDKLKYCKEVLVSIKTASAGGEDGEGTTAEPNAKEGKEKEREVPRETRERERAPTRDQALNKRASRMALR